MQQVKSHANIPGVSRTYTINFLEDRKKLKEYEIEDKNIISAEIQLLDGSIVKGSQCYVSFDLLLHSEAMLSFGEALVRKAIELKEKAKNNQDIKYDYLVPRCNDVNSSEPIESEMGICLTPESCELLISAQDFGTVEDMLKKLDTQAAATKDVNDPDRKVEEAKMKEKFTKIFTELEKNFPNELSKFQDLIERIKKERKFDRE
jgi:hypothetical protein